MKRILLLFLSALLVCSCLILSASAEPPDRPPAVLEGLAFDPFTDVALSEPLTGLYTLVMLDSSGVFYESPVLDFDDYFYHEEDSIRDYSWQFPDGGPHGIYIDIFGSYYESDGIFYFSANVIPHASIESVMIIDYHPVEYFLLKPYTPELPPEQTSSNDVLSFFSEVSEWIIGSIASVGFLFWSEELGELTALGIIALCFLGVAIILSMIYLIKRSLRFGQW